jgi:acyl-CoA thioesterase FadM
MQVTDLPFNQLLGILPSDKPEFLLMLAEDKKYTNHLGTVHAAAMFSLAEATAGQFMLNQFPDLQTGFVPVLRKAEVKYKKPGLGVLYSSARIGNENAAEIYQRILTQKRALFQLEVHITDSNNLLVFQGVFDWFVSAIPSE